MKKNKSKYDRINFILFLTNAVISLILGNWFSFVGWTVAALYAAEEEKTK